MIKRNSGRIAAVIAVICLLLTMFSFSVSAEGGSLTYRANSVAEGVGVDLIRIGSIENGGIVFDEPFAFMDAQRLTVGTSSDAMDAAAELADAVLELDVYTASAQLERLDKDGVARWKSIDTDAVYIIIQHDGQGKCKIQPSVFSCPIMSDGEVVYDVNVQAKLENNADRTQAGSVVVNKLGYKNKRLEGARFSFWEKIYYTSDDNLPDNVEFDEDYYGTFYWKQLGDDLVTDENGQITVDNLPIGTYRFIETGAPEGYLLDESAHEFDISEFSVVNVENGLYVTEGTSLNIENEVDPEDPPAEFIADGGGEEPPPPGDGGAPVVIDDGKPQLTGDDIMKYIGIGAIVVLSLGAVILLVILGGKRDKKNNRDK